MITFSPLNQSYTLQLQCKTTSSLSAQPVLVQVQLLYQVFKMSFSFTQAWSLFHH